MEDFYLSLENGASVSAKLGERTVELTLAEGTGAADWKATMQLDRYDVLRLVTWLNQNVPDRPL